MKLQALTVALAALLAGPVYAECTADSGGSESSESPQPMPEFPVYEDLYESAWFDGIMYNLRDIELSARNLVAYCMSGPRRQGDASFKELYLGYQGALERWNWRNVRESDFHGGKFGVTYGQAMLRYRAAMMAVERACARRGKQDQGQQQQDQGQQDQGQQDQGQQDQGQQGRQGQGQQLPQEQGKHK